MDDTHTNKNGSWAGGRSRTKEGHTTKKGWKHNERHGLGRQDQRQGGEPTRLGGQGFLDVLLDPPQQVRPEHLVQLGDLWQQRETPQPHAHTRTKRQEKREASLGSSSSHSPSKRQKHSRRSEPGWDTQTNQPESHPPLSAARYTLVKYEIHLLLTAGTPAAAGVKYTHPHGRWRYCCQLHGPLLILLLLLPRSVLLRTVGGSKPATSPSGLRTAP